MFLMAFYAMHKPKNEVEKMKHKKTEPPQTNGRTICFSNVIFAKEGFFSLSFNSHSDPESCQSHNLK